MAAGDLLTDDWQFELYAVLYGRGTDVLIDDPGVDGLGSPDAKTQDVDLDNADGVFGGPDYLQLRVVTIPVLIAVPSDPAAAMTDLADLRDAWAPVTDDIPLAIQLPGGKFIVNGRPRSLKPDLTEMSSGMIRALLRFDCPDPTITYL